MMRAAPDADGFDRAVGLGWSEDGGAAAVARDLALVLGTPEIRSVSAVVVVRASGQISNVAPTIGNKSL